MPGGKHNRAIVCASCDGSNTLRSPRPSFLHTNRPQYFCSPPLRWISPGARRRSGVVRETDTFLELVAIKKKKVFQSDLMNRVGKQRPVTSTSPRRRKPRWNPPFFTAVRKGGNLKKKNKNKTKQESRPSWSNTIHRADFKNCTKTASRPCC